MAGSHAAAAWNSAVAPVEMPITRPGTFRNLRVRVTTAPGGGAGNYFDFTMVKGGAAQALTCRIEDAATSATDLVNSFTVVEGNKIAILCDPTGSPAAPGITTYSFTFDGDDAGASMIFTHHISLATDAFMPIGINAVGGTTTAALAGVPAPAAGSAERIRAIRSIAPGGTETVTYTLYKNGVATALAVTLTGAQTENNATASVSWAKGDLLCLFHDASASAAASTGNICMDFLPTVDGTSCNFSWMYGAAISTAADRFMNAGGAVNNGNATESDSYSIAPVAFRAQDLYVKFQVAPGGGKSRATTLRDDGADTTLVVPISETAVDGSDVTHTPSVAAGSLLTLKSTPAGTPAQPAGLTVGWASYIAPASSGGLGPITMLMTGV
jgi:hypothetical protein